MERVDIPSLCQIWLERPPAWLVGAPRVPAGLEQPNPLPRFRDKLSQRAAGVSVCSALSLQPPADPGSRGCSAAMLSFVERYREPDISCEVGGSVQPIAEQVALFGPAPGTATS